MPAPADESKRKYMFTDDIKFFQKVALLHPDGSRRFLTIKRADYHPIRPNKWDLPGGNVMFGEKHWDSLLREIAEETGLEIGDINPVQVETNFENNIYYIFIGYRAQATTDSVTLSNEHTEFRWVTKDEFEELDSAYYLRQMVNQL